MILPYTINTRFCRNTSSKEFQHMPITLKYLPDPGLLVDSITALSLKLNKPKKWQGKLNNLDGNEVKYVIEQLSMLPDPPQNLLIFFYRPKKNVPYYAAPMLVQLQNADICTLSLDTIQTFLKNQQQLVSEVMSLYLGRINPSVSNYEPLINTCSTFPKKIKSLLIDFVHDPSSFISPLSDFIGQYYQILKEKHLSNMKPASFPLLTEEKFKNLISLLFSPPKATSEDFQNLTIYYSYCYIVRDYFYYYFEEEMNYLILGCDFNYTLFSLNNRPSSDMLHCVATALSDLNRIRILHYLQQHPSQSKQALCRALQLSSSNIHRHIQLLKDAHMILEQKKDRSLFYSIDLSGFDYASALFKSIAQGRRKI